LPQRPYGPTVRLRRRMHNEHHQREHVPRLSTDFVGKPVDICRRIGDKLLIRKAFGSKRPNRACMSHGRQKLLHDGFPKKLRTVVNAASHREQVG
jgi:hypothetical protein